MLKYGADIHLPVPRVTRRAGSGTPYNDLMVEDFIFDNCPDGEVQKQDSALDRAVLANQVEAVKVLMQSGAGPPSQHCIDEARVLSRDAKWKDMLALVDEFERSAGSAWEV